MCDFYALPRIHSRQLCPTDTSCEVVSCVERAPGTTALCSGNLRASFSKRHGLFLKEGYENFHDKNWPPRLDCRKRVSTSISRPKISFSMPFAGRHSRAWLSAFEKSAQIAAMRQICCVAC